MKPYSAFILRYRRSQVNHYTSNILWPPRDSSGWMYRRPSVGSSCLPLSGLSSRSAFKMSAWSFPPSGQVFPIRLIALSEDVLTAAG